MKKVYPELETSTIHIQNKNSQLDILNENTEAFNYPIERIKELSNASEIQVNHQNIYRGIDPKEDDDPKIINVERLKNAIEKGEKSIKVEDINIEKTAVLVLGRTGAGKSTMTMLLHGCKLKSHDKDGTGQWSIESAAKESLPPEIFIEEKARSGTQIPVGLKDKTEQIFYWDTPGFGDNRGVTQDLINGYYIKRIFETHESIKILFAISQASIYEDRAKLFLEVTDNLSKALSVAGDDYLKSLAVVITHADSNITGDNIRNQIKSKILNAGLKMEPLADKFCNFLSSANSKIIIMNKPTESIENWTLEKFYSNFRYEVVTAVKKLEPMKSPNIHIIVDKKTKDAILELSKNIEENINNLAQDYINNDLVEYISQLLKPELLKINIDSSNELAFEKINSCKSIFTKIKKVIEQDPAQNKGNESKLVGDLLHLSTEYNIPSDNIKNLQDRIITLDFCSSVNQEVGTINVMKKIFEIINNKIHILESLYQNAKAILLNQLSKSTGSQFKEFCDEIKKTDHFNKWYSEAQSLFKFIREMSDNDTSKSLIFYLDKISRLSKDFGFKVNYKALQKLKNLIIEFDRHLGEKKYEDELPELKKTLKIFQETIIEDLRSIVENKPQQKVIKELCEQIESFKLESIQTKQKIKEFENKGLVFKEDMERIQKSNRILSNENQELKKKNLSQEIASLTNQNKNFQRENQNLLNQNKNFQSENQNLLNQNKNFQSENQNLLNQNKNFQSENQNLKNKNQNLNEENQNLKKECKCTIFSLLGVKYDNEALNYPGLAKYISSKIGFNSLLNFGSKVDGVLVAESVSSGNYDIALAGFLSLAE